MRRVTARFLERTRVESVLRVIELSELATEWVPDLNFAAIVRSDSDAKTIQKLKLSRVDNIVGVSANSLQAGDIVVESSRASEALVVFRETDTHHALQLTNRCNSNCLMCSQPPTKHYDGWLVDQACDIVRHIRVSPTSLGLSGGEPLLLGEQLRPLLDRISDTHPMTRVEVLTNGRLLADPRLAQTLLSALPKTISWLVPLYGHADFIHDFVVQTPGAFEETIAGLIALQEYETSIQLRIVLVQPVLEILPELCGFIGRNLPFVREVALMACEPIGFALANPSMCRVDLLEWSEELEESAMILRRFGIPHLLMNTPLCSIPPSLWGIAQKSISDWKNVYAEACDTCTVKTQCAGLFAWHEKTWAPTAISPIRELS